MADFSHFSDGQSTYDVCDDAARSNLTSHINTSVLAISGAHGLKYDKDEKVMYYQDPDTGWEEAKVGSGGHVIVDTEGTSYEQRDSLKFDDMQIEDDELNNTTVVHSPVKTIGTITEWEQMSDEDKNNGTVYYLPWKDVSGNSLTFDKTPIGTVLNVVVDTTQIPSGQVWWPTEDYLLCNGATLNVADYRDLVEYFTTAYGSADPFGDGSDITKFTLPDWHVDYPQTGVLSIKAKIRGSQITPAEVRDDSTSAYEVKSAQYVYNCFRRTRRDITDDIKVTPLKPISSLVRAVAEQDLAYYGLSIGDYFIGPTTNANNKDDNNQLVHFVYYLADMNPYKGGRADWTTENNHIGIVVDTLINSTYNATSPLPVSFKYENSTLHTKLKGDVLDQIKADFKELFGGSTGLEHLISLNKYYPALDSSSKVTYAASTNKEYIAGLTECQIYGGEIYAAPQTLQQGESPKILEIFNKYKYTDIFGNNHIWLRCLYSASRACNANSYGSGNANSVSYSFRAAGLINFY